MQWPSNSPDLNPMENLRSIIKRKIYSGGRQYNKLDELWAAIESAAKKITQEEILSLTASVDRRLECVLAAQGRHIGY